ncbi:MAG: PEP/pyruvate-binding domain-containing protein [Thermodesulfobacteriota bacterium]
MELLDSFGNASAPFFEAKYDRYLQVLGAADLDLRNYPVKLILLNILKKEGLPVPDGVLVNLKPFYEALLEIFHHNRHDICQYLKAVANEIQFADNGKIEKDIIINELMNIGSAQFSYIIKDIEAIFQLVLQYLKEPDLLLRGGDDDVDGQAGKTTSLVIRDFLLASFDVLAGYTNHAGILERSQHVDVILPLSNTLTDRFFYTHELTPIETNVMVSLAQKIAKTKHAGTISVDDKFVHIEVSDKRFYHENSLSPTYTIFYNKSTALLEGLDPIAQRQVQRTVVKKNCYDLIRLAEKTKKIVQKVNPLFNRMLLEVCLNLDEEHLLPAIVQVKTIYAPFAETVSPKSGIFQIKLNPRQYLNKSTRFSCHGPAIALERPQDIELLDPDSIAVLKIEDWKNIDRFPCFPPRNRPRVMLTNGGSMGMHLITQLKMYGENVAKIDKEDFQPLFELALVNKAEIQKAATQTVHITEVLIERDHRDGKFGRMNWRCYRECTLPPGVLTEKAVERMNAEPEFGSFRDWEFRKALDQQAALNHPAGYINPDSELISFVTSVDDEEGDGIRIYKGQYVQFTIRAVHKKRIAGIIQNSYELNRFWAFLSAISEMLGNDWLHIDYQKSESRIKRWIDGNHPDLKAPLLTVLKTPKVTWLRILEVERNSYGTFSGKVLDPGKYRYLSTKNVIDLVFRSGVTYNLTITADAVNACNHLSTHFILRAVFEGNVTAIRGSTAEGRVGYADSWNGLYEYYPRDEYLARIPDLLNSLYTLKSIGLDPCFEVKYIQRWIENGSYQIANAILRDDRFEEKVVLPIIDHVILPVIDVQGVIHAMIPFSVYKHCLELLDYKTVIPSSKRLWETVKRYFNHESLKSGTAHHIFQAEEKWVADIIFPADIPGHLENLLVVSPGSDLHPSTDAEVINALKVLATISHTTPFTHDPAIRPRPAGIPNSAYRKRDLTEMRYRKLRWLQSADEPEAVSADTYFNRHVLGLNETIKVSRLLLDRVHRMEDELIRIGEFDACLRTMAAAFLDHLGFRRFEFFDLFEEDQAWHARSRLAMDPEDPAAGYGMENPALRSSYYLEKKAIVPNGILDTTRQQGARIYINPEVDHCPIELHFKTPFITVRVLNGFGQPMGIIKVDSVSFTLNTIPNYKYILNIIKPYVFVLEQLSSCLTCASIDAAAVPRDLGQEKALAFRKNEARSHRIDKFVKLLLRPPETFAAALNTVALGLMQYPYNFKIVKIFSYDPETRVVLSDRVWADKNRFPSVNTESSFWNKGMGRHLKTGEIFWEAMVHNKPVVVLNPANDPRCNTLKYRFLPAGPCIIAPLGATELMGFIKLEGYPAGKDDISLAKTTIKVDHLDMVSRMEQSLYEKAKSIQQLTKRDFPIFSKITRAKLIEKALTTFNQNVPSLRLDPKPVDIDTKVNLLLGELKKRPGSGPETDTRIAVITTLSQIASSVINNREIILGFLNILSAAGTDTRTEAVLVPCLESLFVYCHVSDVAVSDKKAIYHTVTRFYIDHFDSFAHDRRMNFQVKNSILRTLSLLHMLPDVAWNDWVDFFHFLAGRRDDPEIIARVINCIITFVQECPSPEATLGTVDLIDTIARHNEANQKNKYEAWGYIGPRPEVPQEMTRRWADEMLDHLNEISEYHDEAILVSESIITALGNLYAADKIDAHQKQLIHFKLLTGLRRKDIRYKHFVLATVGEICKNSLLDMKTRHALMDQVMLMLGDASEMIRTRAASILIYLAGEHVNYLIDALRGTAFDPGKRGYLEKLWYVLFRYRNNRMYVTPRPPRSLWLREAIENPPEQVGYKGLALGELIRKTVSATALADIPESDRHLLTGIQAIIRQSAGMPEKEPTLADVVKKLNTLCFTPDGKIIGNQAFHAFIHHTGLIDIIPNDLPAGHDADPVALRKQMEEEGKALEAYFHKAQMPEEIISMLERDRTKLIYRGDSQGIQFKGISLRSASDEEDSARHAAAGRFSSYHNLKSNDELITYLKSVWASAWSPEARLHRHFFAQTPKKATDINMAVIMQLMVPDVNISGVVFVKKSRDGNGFDTEINAGLGLEAGTRSDDTTDYYSLKDGDTSIFKDIGQQQWVIMPAEEGLTKKISLPPEKGNQQKLSDYQILCLAYICRRLTRELLKPCMVKQDLMDIPEVAAKIQVLFPGQETGKWTIHHPEEIKTLAARIIQDPSQLDRFHARVDQAVRQSGEKIGIDFEFAVTESRRIALLQQREISAASQGNGPLPTRVRFDSCHGISLPIEPFVYGSCYGEIIFMRKKDPAGRMEVLEGAGGKILIADHLDERNLDQFISGHPPLGVIIEAGSKNAHIVIEAREYFKKNHRSIPVVKIANALALFAECKTVGIVAEERHVSVFFQDAPQRDLFAKRLRRQGTDRRIASKADVPFEAKNNPEGLAVPDIPEDRGRLIQLLPAETARFNAMTPETFQADLTQLFFINRARKLHLEAMYQLHTESEIFMDYEDARAYYTLLMACCHADPAGPDFGALKKKIETMLSGYGYDIPLDDIYRIAGAVFQFSRRFDQACRQYQWSPGILHFFSVNSSRQVIAARRIFILHPQDGEIVDETPDAFKIVHAGLVPISRRKQEGGYLRGRIMEFRGSGSVLSGDTHMELGLFDNSEYTTQHLATRALVMAARQLLHIGCNPNITVHVLPRHIQYTRELKEEMPLRSLSEI